MREDATQYFMSLKFKVPRCQPVVEKETGKKKRKNPSEKRKAGGGDLDHLIRSTDGSLFVKKRKKYLVRVLFYTICKFDVESDGRC